MQKSDIKENIISFFSNRKTIIAIIIGIIVISVCIIILFVVFNSKKTTEVSADIVKGELEVANADSSDVKMISDNSKQESWKIENNTKVEEQTEKANQQVQTNKTENTENTNQVVVEEQSESSEKNEKGVIYLTFDDGPTTSSTPKILDILKEENVKATFFILNYNEEGEKLIRREVVEGHSVGIHGYSHEYSKIYKSDEAYLENLNKLQIKIKKSTGVNSTITRFPGGSSNTISRKYNKKIMTRMVKKIQEVGYKYYDWNVDSGDAANPKNEKEVYNNVTKRLSLKRSNVVLMHDFANNKKTIAALKNIIEYGKKNGYKFRAITENDDPIVHHGINN